MASYENRFATDKSLQAEGRQAGWLRDRPRPFAEPGVGATYTPDRAYTLERLELTLWIDPLNPEVRGEALVAVAPTPSGMGAVRLDLAEEMSVESVVVEGALDDSWRWRHRDGALSVAGLQASARVRVRYRGRPRLGLYFVGPTPAAPDRPHQAWSQCQDEDGHHFFPCFDHPSVKHPVAITVHAPSRYTVVSNGALTERADAEEGWTRWSWREERPIPAYLITVVVAPLIAFDDTLDREAGPPLRLRYLLPPGVDEARARHLFGRTPEMIARFEARYGVRYPWPRYDQVVVSDFIFGGMENAGATTLTELCITDERLGDDWTPEGLIAHELAHQWFGDLVTCQDWSQSWLNEGWATYSETLWFEHARGAAFAAW